MRVRSVRRWTTVTSALVGATVVLSGVAAAAPLDVQSQADLTAVPSADAAPQPVAADAAPAPVEVLGPQAGPAAAASGTADPDEPAGPGQPGGEAPVAPAGPGIPPEPSTAPDVAAIDGAVAAAVPGPAADTAAAADACTAMSTPVLQAVNPQSQVSLVTKFPSEVRSAAANWGFTEDKGVIFQAAAQPAPGLVPVYRLYHPVTGDFLWILTEAGRDRAVQLYGYELSQTDFYVSPTPVECAVPVYRYLQGDRHRLAVTTAERHALEATGWINEGAKFWATASGTAPTDPGTPPPVDGGDSVFTIAVIPDTQYDVMGSTRLTNRAEWLVENREELDLRFVMHTGDVVDYDTPDHWLYENASRSLKVLDDAGIPTALTIGNHDTAAVGVGGSAKPGGNAKVDVRDTRTFNTYFPASRYDPEGVFEAGKVDNNYQLFSAGGEQWMILTLELWPRTQVVEWARGVVASHPDHNVIVQTHSFLNADGSIYTNHDYGATSPMYLFNRLISQYPNIKMTFSGHVGQASSRADRTVAGTKVASFLGAFHTLSSNPIRLVEIDTEAGTISTRFYGPLNAATWPHWDRSVVGMEF